MRCSSFCLANGIDLAALQRYFKYSNQTYHYYSDVLHHPLPEFDAHVYYFQNGTIVAWNLNKRFRVPLLNKAKNFLLQPNTIVEQDDFTYRVGNTTDMKPHHYFNVDIITVQEDNDEIRLALSYGLSQSIKLEMYERNIQSLINEHATLSHDLAEKGKIRLPRREIAKLLGRIFLTRSQVNLKSEYLNIPKYFWQHPGLEPFYQMVDHYLDIPKRVAALNQRLDVLNELFAMLTNQLDHKHSSSLEVIIILLIAIEIVMSLKAYIWG